MLVKSIFMELRSRLRSCNVYITTGIDFTKNCNLKISIQSNCIVLHYYSNTEGKYKRRDSLSSIESLSESEDEIDLQSQVIPIQEFCQIIPNSMSCLKIDRNNISFRILTEPKNGGNFYKELLSSNNFENKTTPIDLKIEVKEKIDLRIICANCSNHLTESSVTFDRILELPSTNIDMSEWFCHGHGHGNTAPIDLTPNKNDFLYRLTFFVVNNSVLSEKTNKFNSKRDVYHCNRCLAWLGLKNKGQVKLFNSEVKIQQNGVEKRVFSYKNSSDNAYTDDFIHTIECMSQEFNLGFQYTVMCKIVLECTVATAKKQFLLIWIMDKELQVLRDKAQIECDKIELQSTFLTKILYKLELSLNDEVETWLSDPSVLTTEISKNMFTSGLEHLQNMSLRVPQSFRNTNGYCVSFLKV